MSKPTGLPPFSGDDPTCPKCGNVGAHTAYEGYGYCVDGASIRDYRPNERLHRSCQRCGYSWDEATAEADLGESDA